MIFDIDEVLEELYDEFPEIQPTAIKKICKKGLFGIKKKLTRFLDVDLRLEDRKSVKFFLPSTPEQQRTRIARRLFKRKQNEESSS